MDQPKPPSAPEVLKTPEVPKAPKFQPDEDHETESERRNTNIFLAVAAILVVGGGIWLINAFADSRKAQLCLESGRRNCNPIAVAPRKLE